MEAIDWEYKGEGAANVVLDYHGSDPSYFGKVLRIRKARSATVEHDLLSEKEKSLWLQWPSVAAAANEDELMHAYVRDVMRPLLGEQYVDPGMLVPVSKSFLLSVSRNVRDKRPLWRIKAADLDFSCQFALLISDHTRLATAADEFSTLAVEIKPKWGYLPKSQAIAPENQIKTHISRFTMHQHLKHAQGKVNSLSSYCPLDLFSGTRDGIRKALAALFTTAQNNLGVFIGGTKFFTGGGKDDRARLEQHLQNFIGASEEQNVEALQGLVTEALYASDALLRLLQAQEQDCFDIEGMIHVYYSYIQSSCIDCNTLKFTAGDQSGQRQAAISWLHSLPLETQMQLLCKFLTATTAKDCSLMLALAPAHGPGNIVVCPTTKRKYLYKVSLLDLDLKRLGKLPYYHVLDQSIVRFYTKEHHETSNSVSDDVSAVV